MKKSILIILTSVFFTVSSLFWIFMEFTLSNHPDFAAVATLCNNPTAEMLYGMCIGLRPLLVLCVAFSFGSLVHPFIEKYWPARKK